MKPDSTSSISSTNGAHALSLSYQAITTGQRTANETKLKSLPTMAIRDLVETSDREPDSANRRASEHPVTSRKETNPSSEPGGLLDLTG